jgi:hypothetical protein
LEAKSKFHHVRQGQCFLFLFFAIFVLQPKWQCSTGRFSQIWLPVKYESKFLKTSFYISGYLLEPCMDITWLKSSKNRMI